MKRRTLQHHVRALPLKSKTSATAKDTGALLPRAYLSLSQPLRETRPAVTFSDAEDHPRQQIRGLGEKESCRPEATTCSSLALACKLVNPSRLRLCATSDVYHDKKTTKNKPLDSDDPDYTELPPKTLLLTTYAFSLINRCLPPPRKNYRLR